MTSPPGSGRWLGRYDVPLGASPARRQHRARHLATGSPGPRLPYRTLPFTPRSLAKALLSPDTTHDLQLGCFARPPTCIGYDVASIGLSAAAAPDRDARGEERGN